jgi:hypothetical protein
VEIPSRLDWRTVHHVGDAWFAVRRVDARRAWPIYPAARSDVRFGSQAEIQRRLSALPLKDVGSATPDVRSVRQAWDNNTDWDYRSSIDIEKGLSQ